MNNDIFNIEWKTQHNILSQILKTILDCMPQFFF